MNSFEFKLTPKTPVTTRPTICFACVCKNEEKCILTALESVYKFIDYWVICDTGSTDTTCELIKTFFNAKGIPGELHQEEWVHFGHNKTILFEKCHKKADYILHFDADDYFVGDLDFVGGKTQYYINVVKLNCHYPCLLLFDASYIWRFCGVAHTIIRCLGCKQVTTGYLTDRDYYMYSTPDTGARSSDPLKYLKDAEKLKQQFFDTLLDDPDGLNNRSVFYTAQSYRDYGDKNEAIKWYQLYTKLKDTWIEELYYSYIQLGILKNSEDFYISAINIVDDRAEAYLLLGTLYNQTKRYGDAYKILQRAKGISFETVKKKYILFLDRSSYGKFINDELSVACYWLGKFDEGKELLLEILHDPDFQQRKTRLLDNEKHFNNKLNN